MQSFDIDGVILINNQIKGLRPYNEDIIITGRSIEEEEETVIMLREKGICNKVYFNPLPFDKKTRKSSGIHKGRTLARLIKEGHPITVHYDDDIIQISWMKCFVDIPIIHISHCLTEKENIRQGDRT